MARSDFKLPEWIFFTVPANKSNFRQDQSGLSDVLFSSSLTSLHYVRPCRVSQPIFSPRITFFPPKSESWAMSSSPAVTIAVRLPAWLTMQPIWHLARASREAKHILFQSLRRGCLWLDADVLDYWSGWLLLILLSYYWFTACILTGSAASSVVLGTPSRPGLGDSERGWADWKTRWPPPSSSHKLISWKMCDPKDKIRKQTPGVCTAGCTAWTRACWLLSPTKVFCGRGRLL